MRSLTQVAHEDRANSIEKALVALTLWILSYRLQLLETR